MFLRLNKLVTECQLELAQNEGTYDLRILKDAELLGVYDTGYSIDVDRRIAAGRFMDAFDDYLSSHGVLTYQTCRMLADRDECSVCGCSISEESICRGRCLSCDTRLGYEGDDE